MINKAYVSVKELLPLLPPSPLYNCFYSIMIDLDLLKGNYYYSDDELYGDINHLLSIHFNSFNNAYSIQDKESFSGRDKVIILQNVCKVVNKSIPKKQPGLLSDL